MRSRLTRILAFVAFVLLPAIALARAGGGQHYSGGGGGSSSGGGSYGGGSFNGGGGNGGGGISIYWIYWLIRITFEHPLFMLPFWAVVAFVIYQFNNQRAGMTTPREVDRLERDRLVPADDVNRAIELLKQQDPEFDLDAFFERTRKVFLDIQESWFLRDLSTTRLYMSDGLYRRFTTLLALMQLQNQRNGLADAQVIGARLLEVTRTDAFDCLTVRINASMRDVDVPATDTDEQARRKAQSASAEEFAELWTFVRRRGKQTKPGFDLSQGKCPNCGAPFTGGAANKCEYCGSVVNSGNYDWVLSEIVQPSEYLPHDRAAPGLDDLRMTDPDAAAELLQDRGLLLFWKWLEAWAFSDIARLQKVATAQAVTDIGADIDAGKQRGDGFIVRDPAVGGTRVAAVETGVDGFDRVHVEIRWSAVLGNKRTSNYARPQPYRSIVTMIRAAGAKTDAGVGLSNERCGQCGAPLSDSNSTKCEFCGHEFSGAAREWQLDSLVPIEQWRRPDETANSHGNAFATQSERLRLMSVLVAIVKADGVIEPSEMRMLRQSAARWRVPWRDVQALLDSQTDDTFGISPPETREQAMAFVEQMVAAANVDGRVDRRERAVVHRIAKLMGIDSSTVDQMLDAP